MCSPGPRVAKHQLQRCAATTRPNSPNPACHAADRSPITDFKVCRRQKGIPWGVVCVCRGRVGWKQSLSNLFAHNCLFLSRKALKQSCRERSAPPAWSAGQPLLPAPGAATGGLESPATQVASPQSPNSRTLREEWLPPALRWGGVPQPGSTAPLEPVQSGYLLGRCHCFWESFLQTDPFVHPTLLG